MLSFPTDQLATTALYINGLLWAVLLLYSNYQTYLIFLAWKFRRSVEGSPQQSQDLPKVSVQIPVYNEGALVKRILDSISELNYPKELLDVQLLDDSSTADYERNKLWVDELASKGVPIDHIHRQSREGYKAGALKAGMKSVKGDLILILDADFRAPPDLIYKLIPWFDNPSIAMVQGVWSHPNCGNSLIERVTGYWVERHFSIEQFARSQAGHFFHFNGTAGMWRKQAIIDGGNWNADTLAEDLDLSLRTWKKDWKFVFDNRIQVPCDLPSNVRALKIQQSRWSTGAFQVARKHLFNLKDISLGNRLLLGFHLTGYMFPILLLCIAALAPLTSWAYSQHPSDLLKLLSVDLPVLMFIAGLFGTVFYRFLFGGIKSGVLELQAAVVGLGLAPTIATAGIKGSFVKGGEFKRTPKTKPAKRSLNFVWLTELLLGGLAVYGAYSSFVLQVWWNIPLSAMAGVGLFYFFVSGLFPGFGGATNQPALEDLQNTA